MNALQLANTLADGYTGPAAEAATVLRQQAAEIQQLTTMIEKLMETLIQHYGRTCRRYRFQVVYPVAGHIGYGQFDMSQEVFAASLTPHKARYRLAPGHIQMIQHVYGATLKTKETR